MSKLRKIMSVLHRKLISNLNYFSSKRYMVHYTKYLRNIGLDISGLPKYIDPTAQLDGLGYSITHIGDCVIISKNVLFLNHDYSITCGLNSLGRNVTHDAYFLKSIYIGDNVFIGANSILLPGVHIGANSIIGAGSVVRGNIPDNSIVQGNPAQIIAKTTEWAIRKEVKEVIYYNDY